MSDSEVEKLATLTDQEKADLLSWYQSIPESEEELDRLTQTPTRSGIPKWTDSPELVFAVDSLLQSIMGPGSPYQFANYRQIYEAYKLLHDNHAPYSQRLGAQYFQFYVRKWIIKNGLVNVWEDKNATKHNKVNIRFPNGYVKSGVAGFGKKKLTNCIDGQKLHSAAMIPLETVWNSQAYYSDQPAHEPIPTVLLIGK